jgi:hypothetical protein
MNNAEICAALRQIHDVLSMSSAPPRNKWQGLTDMERQMIINKHDGVAWETAIAIEQQLKEKNL